MSVKVFESSTGHKQTKRPPKREGRFVYVDLEEIHWHQFIKEYLEFSAIAKDFLYYLKIPESVHYPLMKTDNTKIAA